MLLMSQNDYSPSSCYPLLLGGLKTCDGVEVIYDDLISSFSCDERRGIYFELSLICFSSSSAL
jgi:hypothetical protein